MPAPDAGLSGLRLLNVVTHVVVEDFDAGRVENVSVITDGEDDLAGVERLFAERAAPVFLVRILVGPKQLEHLCRRVEPIVQSEGTGTTEI